MVQEWRVGCKLFTCKNIYINSGSGFKYLAPNFSTFMILSTSPRNPKSPIGKDNPHFKHHIIPLFSIISTFLSKAAVRLFLKKRR